MTEEITLSLTPETIKKAQSYAQQKGESLSQLVDRLLRDLNVETKKERSPITKRLSGSVKLPPDFDYKKALGEVLDERYGAL